MKFDVCSIKKDIKGSGVLLLFLGILFYGTEVIINDCSNDFQKAPTFTDLVCKLFTHSIETLSFPFA